MIVALATCFSANAQVTVTPKIGLTISSLGYSEDVKDVSARTSMQLGVAFDFGVTSSFSIQPELLYIQKGNKIVNVVKTGTVTKTTTTYLHINYLEIPVLAKAKFGNEDTEFYITGGPSLGIGLSADFRTVVATSLIPSVSTTDKVELGTADDALFKRFDLGLQLGVGVVLRGFTFEVRYGSSIVNIINDPDKDPDALKAYNRTLGITAGYAFTIK